MPVFPLKLHVLQIPCSNIHNSISWGSLEKMVKYTQFQPNIVLWSYHRPMENKCPSYAVLSSNPRNVHSKASLISVDEVETSGPGKHFLSKLDIHSIEKQDYSGEAQLDGYDCSDILSVDNDRKRRKRKHGNKGKIPWNKGKQHPEETCVLIKRRTIEALRDPQVRKKMSEHPLAHSDETKAKISTSLKKLWGTRLRWKRLGQKFFISWAYDIAKAAKTGASDQEELDWDSYEKLKEELTVQKLQHDMDKANAKEQAKIERARAKATKMVRFAQKKIEREWKAKAREEAKRKRLGKSTRRKEWSSISKTMTLKRRLTKLRKKKAIKGQWISQGDALISPNPTWEKLDAEFIKRENVPREFSLAEQIQSAKSKKMESMDGVLAAPSAGRSLTNP
ncbi:hypothetical protein K2173_006698 [Erythroxylum novogranatense]|uniref:Nuclease associated modular domain-containing protein n=1 Tax=Erythroxylum novogranatense TaxID=1862640 RepID=A0AAV8TCU0_9ROSI|nr:hypothetical protein K2173_006698 [Erythroxylum novogranatense]